MSSTTIGSPPAAVRLRRSPVGLRRWPVAVQPAAILVFAVEGARLGAAGGLGTVGVFVMAFVSSLGGGIVRDLLIGATPPSALRSPVFPLVALLGAGLVVMDPGVVGSIPDAGLLAMEAVALGVLCTAGATIAVEHRVHPVAAAALGVLTVAGGGVIRDVLLREMPSALGRDPGVVAAAIGAAITVLGLRCGVRRSVALGLGVAACSVLRLVTGLLGWELPAAAA